MSVDVLDVDSSRIVGKRSGFLFGRHLTCPFIFVVRRVINEPMEATLTNDGREPHRAGMPGGRTAKHNSNEGSLKVLNATKAHHCSTDGGQKVAKRDITKSRRKAKYSSFRTSVGT
jgi:hypothetical protein